jgi:hypothetical protein
MPDYLAQDTDIRAQLAVAAPRKVDLDEYRLAVQLGIRHRTRSSNQSRNRPSTFLK